MVTQCENVAGSQVICQARLAEQNVLRHWALRLCRELDCGQAVAELGLSCWAPLANGTIVRICRLVATPEHNVRQFNQSTSRPYESHPQ